MTAARTLRLSRAEARRLLFAWQFGPRTVSEVFARLGSVQYDPLAPWGSNHDLVLQARVPGYRVGDWCTHAYERRELLDGWDKQASLVRMSDWPLRRAYHRWHGRRWRERVLEPYPEAVRRVREEIEERGPLEVGEVEHQVHVPAWEGSWYGARLTKHVLRALWHTGEVVTHHRRHGRHVYDLAERVVPAELFAAPEPEHEVALLRVLSMRHRAMGLLRPGASSALWSLPLTADERRRRIAVLVEQGKVVPVDVGGTRYHAAPEALATLDRQATDGSVRFMAPLDQLLWDRRATEELFGFEYVWEVYKPRARRRFGYYVLPVAHRNAFVARLDGRRVGGTLRLEGWWWEEGAAVAEVLEALPEAVGRFASYLGTHELEVLPGVPADVAAAFERGFA